MTGSDSSQAATIAIFPFENLSGDSEQDYFARGFVDELTTQLARFSPLAVLHPRSARALAQGRGGEQTALTPNVDYRLDGSVRNDARTVRVTARLTDADDGRQIWAHSYDGPAAETLSIQDQIAASVAAALALKIDSARLGAARRKPIASLAAYDCWLRGMDHLRRGTIADDDAARTFFTRALELDPHYARAYSGLSLSHFNEWSCQGWALWDEKERLAYETARKAVDLEDDDAMVHIVLARVHLYRREFDESVRHLERALELNANEADALAQAALCYGYLGAADVGVELSRKAMRLNPYHDDWYYGCAALAMFAGRDFERGLAMALKAPRATVDLPAYIACAHARAGDAAAARRSLDLFLEDFREKILFGREPEPGEPLRWLLHVNPFRRQEDIDFLAEGLRIAGLIADPDDGERAQPSAGGGAAVTAAFKQEGASWLLRFGGDEVRLNAVKGFRDIAALIAAGGRDLHCLELAGRPMEAGTEMLDARAREEIADEVRRLQAEIDEADAANDAGRRRRAAAELDRLVESLSKAMGLGGRVRTLGSATERARSSVTWRIRSAIKKIGTAHPRLGRHFENAIKTGTFCSYMPENPIDWQL